MRLFLLIPLLALSAIPATAGGFVSVLNRVTVSASSFDPIWDFADSDSDSIRSRSFDEFDEDVSVNISGAGAGASLATEFSSDGQAFRAQGSANSGITIQGSADTSAESLLRIDFTLDRAGVLVFNDGTLTAGPTPNTRDRLGNARAVLRLINRTTGQTVLTRRAVASGFPTTVVDFGNQLVNLPAGSYRIILRARSDDDTHGIQEVAGSDTIATFEIEAQVTSH